MLVRQATPEVERRIARRATLGIVRSAALSSRKLEQQVYGTAEPKQNGGVEARQVHGAAAPLWIAAAGEEKCLSSSCK